MRILKAHQYEVGKEFKVSSQCGYLVVECFSRDVQCDRHGFRWRFESDTAWMFVEVDGGADVIDEICDTAADVYQRTGQRKQPPDHPQYAREAAERLFSKVCVTCQAPMDTPGHGVARLSFATVYSCPTLPKDAMCMLDISGVFPGTEQTKKTKGGVLAGVMEMVNRGWLSTAQARGEIEKFNQALADELDRAEPRRYRPYTPSVWTPLCGVPQPDFSPSTMAPRERAAWHPPLTLGPHEREQASSEWSAQLRAKVEERKVRDAEAARHTPYWSPEEQSGGDL